jgi:hypothetical protein
MGAITGRVEHGLVVLDEPASLADGSRVVVQPIESTEPLGLSESEWQDTPEAIADWIAWYDSLEPVELSANDEQAIAAHRQRQQELAKSAFDERAERLRKIWQ